MIHVILKLKFEFEFGTPCELVPVAFKFLLNS